MTRFPKLWAMLTGRPVISPLEAAYANWREAQTNYDAAKQRGDTRGQHVAWKALKDARTACVKAELEARGR
jgi:hypothetical protein